MTFLYIMVAAVLLLAASVVAYAVGRLNGFDECHRLYERYYGRRADGGKEGEQ